MLEEFTRTCFLKILREFKEFYGRQGDKIQPNLDHETPEDSYYSGGTELLTPYQDWMSEGRLFAF